MITEFAAVKIKQPLDDNDVAAAFKSIAYQVEQGNLKPVVFIDSQDSETILIVVALKINGPIV
jgi:hypothetical protein